MNIEYKANQDRANEMVRSIGLVAKVEVEGRKCTFVSKNLSGRIHYDSRLELIIITVTDHTPLATESVIRKYFDKLFA